MVHQTAAFQRLLATVAAAGLFLLVTTVPVAAQDPIDAADAASFDGYWLEEGADGDLGRLSDLALSADADDQNWYFVSLFEPAVGSNSLFADEVLAELGDDGTVIVVSPFNDDEGGYDVGVASADFSSATIDRSLDEAASNLDPDSGGVDDRFEAVFDAMVDRTPDLEAAVEAGEDEGSGVSGLVLAGAGVAAVGAVGGGVWLNRRRSERKAEERDEQDLETAQAEIKSQLDAVANQIIDDGTKIEASGNEQAITWYREATATFSSVDDELPRTESLVELAELNNDIDLARWKMEAALATAEGREAPAKPDPEQPLACFFDPTHKPGTEWATVKTAAGSKEVRVCEMDAEKLRRGERPDPRMIQVHGRRVPAARAPRSHGGLGMGGIDVFDIVLGGTGRRGGYGRTTRRRSPSWGGGLGGLGGMFPSGRSSGGGMFDWTPSGGRPQRRGGFGTDTIPRTPSNRPRRTTSRRPSGGGGRSRSRSSSRSSGRSSSRSRSSRRGSGGGRRRM